MAAERKLMHGELVPNTKEKVGLDYIRGLQKRHMFRDLTMRDWTAASYALKSPASLTELSLFNVTA